MRDLIRGCLVSAVICGAMMSGSIARADLIPVFDQIAPNGSGAFTCYYTVSIASASRLNTGDYFTIYDYDSYISGSEVAPADWAISEQTLGITPAGQIVPDYLTMVNITFTYVGVASIFGPVNPIGGAGAFSVDSRGRDMEFRPYTSQTHKNNAGKPDDNTYQSNQGRVIVATIPEASSLVLLLPGLVPLGLLLKGRSRLR